MTTRFDLPALAKVNDQLGVVFSWSAISLVEGQPYVDFHGDWIPEDALMEAHLDFAEKSRAMKVEHEGGPMGTVPFVFPLTSDVKKSLEVESKYSGAVLGMKPFAKATLDRFRPGGDLRGVSMGGRRILDEIVKSEGGERVGEINIAALGKDLDFAKDAGAQGKLDAAYEAAYEALAKAVGLARNKLRRIMRKFEIREYSGVTEPAQQPAVPSLIKHRLITLDGGDHQKVAFPGAPRESEGTKGLPTMPTDAETIAAQTIEIAKLKAQMATMVAIEARDAEVAGIKKQLARADGVAVLPAADRDHYAWLGTDAARDSFLGKSRADRDAEIKASVIHTEDDGTLYRVGEEKVVKQLKANDELRKQVAESQAAAEGSELAKAVTLDMGNLPDKPATRTIVLKAVRAIKDPEERKVALAFVKSINVGYGELMKTRGHGGGNPDDPSDPLTEIATIAKALRAADPTLSEAVALGKAWETPRGIALYSAGEQEKINKRAAIGGGE